MLLNEIKDYWAKRAASYTEDTSFELQPDYEENWMRVVTAQLTVCSGKRVLDVGTGPGFLAIGLARRGYEVTAVDYTPEMLAMARKNAVEQLGEEAAARIRFVRADAQRLEFADGSFDAVVTRNLTWNLEDPQLAYACWHRVLKKDGVLLNFDAAWYAYLIDEEKQEGFLEDRRQVKEQELDDFEDYAESDRMEEITKKLSITRSKRPEADVQMMRAAGFQNIEVYEDIGQRVWNAREQVNYASRPMFLIKGMREEKMGC